MKFNKAKGNKMFRFVLFISMTFFTMFSAITCRNEDHNEIYNNKHSYYGIGLVVSTDTLHFPLNSIDNSIESIDPFYDHGIEYVAIYYGSSETINFYELHSQKLVKSISLTEYLLYRRHSTSVYCKNFDSIFISNNKASLFIADSSGIIKSTIYFSEDPSPTAADFINTRPPVLKDSCFYASFPGTDLISNISQMRDWLLVCRHDLKNKKKAIVYRYPKRYMNKFYGYYFLDYSYCFNNHGNFVFSFSADSNLYETDFAEINRTFLGKSKFQHGDIDPVNKNKKGDDAYFEYLKRDCYGSVFFDPCNKRYLRIFKHKISKKDIAEKIYDREKSVVVLDENLQIIGESLLPEGLHINSLFFTSDGRMYVRTKARDTTALHFLRVVYKEMETDSSSLAKKTNNP